MIRQAERQSPGGEKGRLEVETLPVANGGTTLHEIALLLRVMVLAIVIAFCFVASSLCITLILSALLAILIEPLMVFVERAGLGRTLAASVSVLLVAAVLRILAYAIYQKADSFAAQVPAYSYRIEKALQPVIREVVRLQEGAEDLNPTKNISRPEIKITETPNWSSMLFRGVGSFSNYVAIVGIAPFLAFFMLIRKERMYVHFSRFFSGRIDPARFVNRVKGMVRGYVLGNLLVGMVLSGATVIVFWVVGLQAALPLGLVCGFLNTVPFIGGILATLVALAAALLQFDAVQPFVAIGLSVPLLHLIAVNFMIPRLIGPRLMIGPVATTVGMLFWGWLWGIMGLLLAVPLTAFIKLIADSHPRLSSLSSLLARGPEPVSRWVPIKKHTLQMLKSYMNKFHNKRSNQEL